MSKDMAIIKDSIVVKPETKGLYQDACSIIERAQMTAYRAVNSKGDVVMIIEEGWAPEGTEPTHLLLHAISSCGQAFYGGLGNTLWLDNVEIVM